jgi:uncharacterized protein involved in propanediol utilization
MVLSMDANKIERHKLPTSLMTSFCNAPWPLTLIVLCSKTLDTKLYTQLHNEHLLISDLSNFTELICLFLETAAKAKRHDPLTWIPVSSEGNGFYLY